jgi:hypothetical protein
VDNLLARFELPGVQSSGQGTSRHISSIGVYHIALISQLAAALSLPLEAAVRLGVQLLAGNPDVVLVAFHGLELHFDRAAFVASVDERIAEAVESVVPARRGRPVKRADPTNK